MSFSSSSWLIIKVGKNGGTEQYSRNNESEIRDLLNRSIANKSLNGKFRSLTLKKPTSDGWVVVETHNL